MQLAELHSLLSTPIEELQQEAEKNPQVQNNIKLIQAQVNLAISESIYKKIPVSKERICRIFEVEDARIIENGDIKNIFDWLTDIQQRCAYILGEGQLEWVRVNDLGIPVHPLEAELLHMIDEVHSSGEITKNKPLPYTPRHSLGAIAFFKKEYWKYIDAGVIYQDYLRIIDKKLHVAILNEIQRRNDETLTILPPKKQRTLKHKKMLAENKQILQRIHRLKNLKYR